MHKLFVQYPAAWKKKFLGSQDALESYWRDMHPDDPRMQGHPVKGCGDYETKCIPARLHGDGVPYGKGKDATIDVLNFSSMIAIGEVLDIINMWTIVPKKYACTMLKHGVDTMEIVWRWVIYDMLCMMKGEFMRVDAFGKPWSGANAGRPKMGRIMADYFMGFLQFGGFIYIYI